MSFDTEPGRTDKALLVLLVEDDSDARNVFELTLIRRGHSVTTAETGREAIRLLDERDFDVVVLDVLLPDRDGIDVITHMRETQAPGRILAIYIRKIGVGPLRDEQVLELAREIRDEGVPMLLCEDTEAAAVHARESGWIRPEQIKNVNAEKIKDEVAPSPTEVALKAEG